MLYTIYSVFNISILYYEYNNYHINKEIIMVIISSILNMNNHIFVDFKLVFNNINIFKYFEIKQL